MNTYSLAHVPDPVLLRDLKVLIALDRITTAELLAHIAEVDARKLYVPAAHPSMFSYCVEELGLSEDAAAKRIQVSRVGRKFPAVLKMLAEGRLHLCGAILLAPHLTPENVHDLLDRAAGRRKSQIEQMLAERFPRTELIPMVQPLTATSPVHDAEHAPGHVASGQPTPPRVSGSEPRSRVAALAAQRFAVQFTMSQESQEDLLRIQELMGHGAGIDEIFTRSLKLLRQRLERRKLAATDRPRKSRQPASSNPRHIPAPVRRAVWQRDCAQCTYVSESGKRCQARAGLELDHVVPVAWGGQATTSRVESR